MLLLQVYPEPAEGPVQQQQFLSSLNEISV